MTELSLADILGQVVPACLLTVQLTMRVASLSFSGEVAAYETLGIIRGIR